jgi:hypothetical protein
MEAMKLSKFESVLFKNGFANEWEKQEVDQSRRDAYLEMLKIIAQNAKTDLSRDQIRSRIMDFCRTMAKNRDYEQVLDWVDWAYWIEGFGNSRSIAVLEKRLEALKNVK